MFVDFHILNELGSPSINSNTFANRPAAGQTGRLFVSTDTFEIYRDNGTGWDLIGGPGSSTVTGSGAAGQVTYWTGTNTVIGENALFWDAAQNHLGINTATPTVALDVHSAADVALQLNGTGATPSIFQQFLSAGVSQYQVGYNWNASADYRRFSIYDSQGSKEVISIDQQSRYVGINFQYTSLTDQPQYTLDVDGSIRGQNLYVTSNSEDTLISNTKPVGGAGQNVFFGNGGANVVFTTVDTGSYNTGIGWGALSLLTTGYRNVGIGQVALETLTTGYNNVAIGDNSGRFYTSGLPLTNANQCIFIGRNAQASADNITNEIVIGAESIGLGSNSVTLGNASITKTYLRGEVLVNTTTDVGAYNLQVNGAGYFSGNLGIGASIANNLLTLYNASSAIYSQWIQSATGTGSTDGLRIGLDASSNGIIDLNEGTALITSVNGSERMRISSGGNVLINTVTDGGAKLAVNGATSINTTTNATYSKLIVAGGIHFNNNADASTIEENNFGNAFAKKSTVTGGAGATTIKPTTGPGGGLYVVSGNDVAGNFFTDLVLLLGRLTTAPVVISSQNYASPATRTYTNSGENLQLALSGSSAYSVYITGIGSNETT